MYDLAKLMYEPPSENTGTLSAADIDALLEQMFANAQSYLECLPISCESMWSLRLSMRIGRINRAHPLPRRKIRKCHMHRLYTTRRKAMAHIRRVDQAEIFVRAWATAQQFCESIRKIEQMGSCAQQMHEISQGILKLVSESEEQGSGK